MFWRKGQISSHGRTDRQTDKMTDGRTGVNLYDQPLKSVDPKIKSNVTFLARRKNWIQSQIKIEFLLGTFYSLN